MWDKYEDEEIVKTIMDIYLTKYESNRAWDSRINEMLSVLIAPFVWLRDNRNVQLSCHIIWDNMSFLELSKIANGEKYPELPVVYKTGIKDCFTKLSTLSKDIAYIHGYFQHELISTFKELGLDK